MSTPPSLEVLREEVRRFVRTKAGRKAMMDTLRCLSGGKPLPKWRKRVPNRVQASLHALLGKPTAYRLRLTSVGPHPHHASKRTLVINCYVGDRET